MAQRIARRAGHRLIHKALERSLHFRLDLMDDVYNLLVVRLHFDGRLGQSAVKAVQSSDAEVNGIAKGVGLSIFSTHDAVHLFFRARPPADRRVQRALNRVFVLDAERRHMVHWSRTRNA